MLIFSKIQDGFVSNYFKQVYKCQGLLVPSFMKILTLENAPQATAKSVVQNIKRAHIVSAAVHILE